MSQNKFGGIIMEELTKTARVIDIFAKILFIFCIVACCMLIAANIFTAVAVSLPTDDLPKALSLVFNFDDSDFVVFENGQLMVTKQQFAIYVLAMSLTVATSVVILMIGIKLIRRILSPMKEGRPFEDGISKIIKKFGHFVLALTVISPFFQLLLSAVFMMIGAEPEQLPISISGEGIFAALVIYLISYIFRYGEELQKQADETL